VLTHLTLPVTVSDVRLDKVVALAYPGIAQSFIAKAFDEGNITLDGRAAGKGESSVAGQTLHISTLMEEVDRCARAVEGPLDIVYESTHLLGFNKPRGQNCHPIDAEETDTLVNAIIARYPRLATIGGNPMMPALLHRIDRGTSGLVLAARNDAVYRDVRDLFAMHRVDKVYHALVEGRVDARGGVTGYLAHAKDGAGKMRVVTQQTAPGSERALRAETFYKPIHASKTYTLLEVLIRTGVTHQIRCHLASIGHPIVGDTLYGAAPSPIAGPDRFFLHAFSVSMELTTYPPKNNTDKRLLPNVEELRIVAPLPNDFKVALATLS